MTTHKVVNFNSSGQSTVEYALTLTVVFLSFVGVTTLFSGQLNRYLSQLFDMVKLPF